jgi:ABC-type sugar transport system substrate-binding protein
MPSWKGLPSMLGTVGLGIVLATGVGTAAKAQDKKYKVYFDLSITGGGWLTAATNAVKALAATPPYDKMVDLKVVVSGTDPQRQISSYQSMIADGADAIVSMPISVTALNRTVKAGCDKGVLFFNFEQTVTEPCAYNVSTVTSRYGENGAQTLVNMLNGKGKIFFNHVIPGAPAGAGRSGAAETRAARGLLRWGSGHCRLRVQTRDGGSDQAARCEAIAAQHRISAALGARRCSQSLHWRSVRERLQRVPPRQSSPHAL